MLMPTPSRSVRRGARGYLLDGRNHPQEGADAPALYKNHGCWLCRDV